MSAGASPANSEELAIIQQGAKAWNEWRGKNKERASFNLSGADLHGRDLTGADLRAVDLCRANLRGAKLGPRTLLWNANLSNADLYQINLRGADLQDVNFSNADLFQADLRESNLQGADLSTAKGGLLSRQLAGSDLTGAKLPDPLSKLYDSLSSVKEISDSAQKLFLALLAGCLYSWLTIAQTTDVELITNRATTPLPIIQAAIPIVGFYVVAPLILLCLYFYFHFYLQKLWEELGSLPAVFTDGRELHKRTDPWLLNDLVRSHFVKLKGGRPFLSSFQAWVSVLLAWWLVPITLFMFWQRFVRRHDLFWTMVHALLLSLAIFSAVRLYRIASEALRGEDRAVFHWKDVLIRPSIHSRFLFFTSLSALLIAISLGVLFGEPYWPSGKSRMQLKVDSPRTWMPWLLDRSGYYPFANLKNTDISAKPSNWTGKKVEELDLVKGANLSGSDLRNADAIGAFLVKADLSRAHVEGANLEDADLRDAFLNHAHMADITLFQASLRKARMVGVDLENADLSEADLVGAQMDSDRLNNADLSYADLTGASLKRAVLTHADLSFAKLSALDISKPNFGPSRVVTDLSASDLRNADFTEAKLQRANLEDASLDHARLSRTDLYRANLRGSDLTDATFAPETIRYADFRQSNHFQDRRTRGLTREMLITIKDWQCALYDSEMLKQLGLPPDHNEKLAKEIKIDVDVYPPGAYQQLCPAGKDWK